MFDDAAIHQALSRAPPRSAQVVMRVGLDGWTLAQLAEHYGVASDAAAVLLLRALRDLHASLEGRPAPAAPQPAEEERPVAHELARALESIATSERDVPNGTSAPAGASSASRSAACPGEDSSSQKATTEVRLHLERLRAIAAHRDAVRRRIADAEEAAARAPARARENWLRRAAILAILALSAWFYWTERQRPPKGTLPPRTLPRDFDAPQPRP
jgi:hypothetical protein